MSKVIPFYDTRYSSNYLNRYLVLINEVQSLDEFLNRSKVSQGSYAGEISNGIWKDLFVNSLDLKRDFDKYFSNEYTDFRHFLQCNYILPEYVLKGANRLYNSYRHIFYYKPWQTFLHEEGGAKVVRSLVGEEKKR